MQNNHANILRAGPERIIESIDVSDEFLHKTVKDFSSNQSDLYRRFVIEATKFSRLTEEQERELGLRVREHNDVKAKKELVVRNLRLVMKLAHQHRRPWTNVMDLIQEASAGMTIAAERWDPDMGTRFGTYAVHWMRSQLTKYLMTNGRTIHTGNTRAGRRLYFQLPKIKRKLLSEGKDVSIRNIAKEIEETEEEVALILARLEGTESSLEAPLGDSESGSLLDLIASDDQGPEASVSKDQLGQLLAEIVACTRASLKNDRDRAIWDEFLFSNDPTSLHELGIRYGVSKQRMSQLADRMKQSFKKSVVAGIGRNNFNHFLND